MVYVRIHDVRIWMRGRAVGSTSESSAMDDYPCTYKHTWRFSLSEVLASVLLFFSRTQRAPAANGCGCGCVHVCVRVWVFLSRERGCKQGTSQQVNVCM